LAGMADQPIRFVWRVRCLECRLVSERQLAREVLAGRVSRIS
jgi:hypothetical protein